MLTSVVTVATIATILEKEGAHRKMQNIFRKFTMEGREGKGGCVRNIPPILVNTPYMYSYSRVQKLVLGNCFQFFISMEKIFLKIFQTFSILKQKSIKI